MRPWVVGVNKCGGVVGSDTSGWGAVDDAGSVPDLACRVHMAVVGDDVPLTGPAMDDDEIRSGAMMAGTRCGTSTQMRNTLVLHFARTRLAAVNANAPSLIATTKPRAPTVS